MNKKSRILTLSMCVLLLLSGCGNKTTSSSEIADIETTVSEETAAADNDSASESEILNFTPPQEGEEIAVLTIKDYGDIKIKLFPEQCPKGVENFVTHIKEGNYNGVIFHRVIEDFMIQGGDIDGLDGIGGRSIYEGGLGFEQEINPGLCHFAGAVSYATASDKLNKSQFFIVTGENQSKTSFATLEMQSGKRFTDAVKEMYYEKGGYPYLDGDYEVFGQVFEGYDIVLDISKTDTDSSDKPLSDIVIAKAEIINYTANS